MTGILMSASQIFMIILLSSCSPTTPITICHATTSESDPYREITVSAYGLNGHGKHVGDIIPAPVDGCPTIPVVVTDGKITICHATSSETNPYNEITISLYGLNGHGRHEGDLYPMPEAGCPDTRLDSTEGRIRICHMTGSDKNPYTDIAVSINGLNGHGNHEGDIIPAPAGSCPTTKP